MGIIHTDHVYIDQVRYPVYGGKVVRNRVLPQNSFQVQREDPRIVRGDLNPALQTYEIKDFAGGSGLYVDNGQEFSRVVWFSTLNHSVPGVVVLADRRQAAGEFPSNITFQIEFKNYQYAGTGGNGLFRFNTATDTYEQVPSSPLTQMLGATIIDKYLYIARSGGGSDVRYDGTSWTTPGTGANYLVATIDNKLVGVAATDVNGLAPVKMSSDLGVTWTQLVDFAGKDIKLPLDSWNPNRILVAPDSGGEPQIYVSAPDGVYIINYRIGVWGKFYDSSHNIHGSNGRLLKYWPSTGRIYLNERGTVIEVDIATRQARSMGPNPTAVPTDGLPAGFPDGYQGNIESGTTDANYLYIGTDPDGSSDYAVVWKMGADGRWYWHTRSYQLNKSITAMNFSSVDGYRFYFAEQVTAGQATGWFLDFRGDYAEEGEIHTPWITFGLPDMDKCLYNIEIEANALTASETLIIGYRTNYNEGSTSTFTAITSSDTPPYSRTFGTVPHAVGVTARAFKFVFKLVRGATTTNTPKLLHINIRWRPVPPPIYDWDVPIIIDDQLDRMVETNYEATLSDSLEDKPAVSFVPSGNVAATAVVTVILSQRDEIVYQEGNIATVVRHLVLAEILPSASGVTNQVTNHTHRLDSFTGTGAQTAFTLTQTPIMVLVFVNDTFQREGAGLYFTRSGVTITFTTAPASGAAIRVEYPYLT